jgi:hypothetical protein
LWKGVRQLRKFDAVPHRRPKRGGDATGQLRGGFHGDLLTQDRTHRDLKPIPSARHAQARPGLDQFRQRRIKRERRRDRAGVGAQIEDAADARDDR